MTDRERVIKGLEIQLDDVQKYADPDEILTLTQEQAKDIVTLLKEQEAVTLKPHYIDKYGKNFICGVECGNCGVEISATYKFCPYCGRAVKLE